MPLAEFLVKSGPGAKHTTIAGIIPTSNANAPSTNTANPNKTSRAVAPLCPFIIRQDVLSALLAPKPLSRTRYGAMIKNIEIAKAIK